MELLLLLDERVRVGEVAALRVARELLAPLLNEGFSGGCWKTRMWYATIGVKGAIWRNGMKIEGCEEENREKNNYQQPAESEHAKQ